MTDPEGSGSADAHRKGEPEGRPELDIDSAFAAIIADFAAPTPHGVGPWPAIEDIPDDDTLTQPAMYDPRSEALPKRIVLPGEEFHDERAERRAQERAEAAEHAAGAQDDAHHTNDDDEDDEGYVPPEPPPLPRGDLVSRAAWAAVIGGPLFLLLAALTWRDLPSTLLLLALIAFVGGFVTLVARMPQEHPDDPDDGAVV